MDVWHGISSQNLPKIFDPYFSTQAQGSGLGFTVYYSIVKKHGGHISVQSVEGKGISFTIYLHVSCVQAEEVNKDILIFGQRRVLLMDDEPCHLGKQEIDCIKTPLLLRSCRVIFSMCHFMH